MNIEDFRLYCVRKNEVTEGFPFDNRTLVFKTAGKMFALCDVEDFEFVNLKCDPERAAELREQFDGIRPGYHMNKRLWNSVYTNSDVPDELIFELTDHSYQLIAGGKKK